MNKSFNDLACYVCLVLTGCLALITGVLPSIGISIGGYTLAFLVNIQQVALIIGVSFGALAFAKKKTIMVIIAWLAIIITVLNLFGVI